MTTARLVVALAVVAALSAPAVADDPRDKRAATVLLKKGVDLFNAGKHQEALELFQSAYETYKSPKILLNIGTSLAALGRKAEAADAYARYLDAGVADEARDAEVRGLLAELDAGLGRITVTVNQTGGTVSLDERVLGVYQAPLTVRATPGEHRVSITPAEGKPVATTVTVVAGQTHDVPLQVEVVAATTETPAFDAADDASPAPDLGVSAQLEPPSYSAFTAVAFADVDYKLRGAAAFVGALYQVVPRVHLGGAALIGRTAPGLYAGVTYELLDAVVKPSVSAGVPVFFSDGVRAAVRGSVGVSVSPTPRFDIALEVGVEHYVNPEDGFEQTFLVPALGVRARI